MTKLSSGMIFRLLLISSNEKSTITTDGDGAASVDRIKLVHGIIDLLQGSGFTDSRNGLGTRILFLALSYWIRDHVERNSARLRQFV
jgi:hypothetical protein